MPFHVLYNGNGSFDSYLKERASLGTMKKAEVAKRKIFYRSDRYKKMGMCLRIVALMLLMASVTGCTSTGTRADYLKEHNLTEASEETTASLPQKPSKKRVALTFDDGPNYLNTETVLDALEQYQWKATFFVVGNRITNESKNTLLRMASAGHEIGIHGYTHTNDRDHYYDTCTDAVYEAEISDTISAIQAYLPDYTPRLMRPIGGRISTERVQKSPYSIILWSIDTEDWNHKYYPGISDSDAEERVNIIVQNALNSVKDGDIILMHDIYQSSADATVKILAKLYAMGFEVVTVSELLGNDPHPGVIYTAGLPVS